MVGTIYVEYRLKNISGNNMNTNTITEHNIVITKLTTKL